MISEQEKNLAEDLRKKIAFNKGRLRRLQKLKKGQGGDFWKALKEDIEYSIKANEFEINQQVESPMAGVSAPEENMAYLKSRGGANRAYRGILFNVDQAERKVIIINNTIADLNEKLDQIKERSGKQKQTAVQRGRSHIV